MIVKFIVFSLVIHSFFFARCLQTTYYIPDTVSSEHIQSSDWSHMVSILITIPILWRREPSYRNIIYPTHGHILFNCLIWNMTPGNLAWVLKLWPFAASHLDIILFPILTHIHTNSKVIHWNAKEVIKIALKLYISGQCHKCKWVNANS